MKQINKKTPFSQRRNGNILCEQHVSQSMCFYDDVFRLKGGWVGIPPFFRAARGQTLLRSPVVFQPVVQFPFPVRLCLLSAVSGFGTAVVLFIAWIWTL